MFVESLEDRRLLAIGFGEAAIIGFQTQTPDEFSIAFFADVTAGEQFYFADLRFDSPNSVNIGFGRDPYEVTLNSNVAAGSVLKFTDGAIWSTPGHTVNFVGSGPYSDGGASTSLSSGESFLLFDSTDGAQSIGASTNLFYVDGSNGTGAIPSGLSFGNGAVSMGVNSNFRYKASAPHSGSAAALFAAVSDGPTNWEGHAAAADETNTGPFTVISAGPAPTVTNSNAPDVTEAGIGATTYTFDVTYEVSSGNVDTSTIDTGDVTINGPGGALTLTAAVPSPAGNAPSVTVTYSATPPGGFWNAGDDGTYTIMLAANQVANDTGTFATATSITTFDVDATNTAPVVTDRLAEDVIFPDLGETSYSFTIQYSDSFHDVDVSSIGNTDVTVTGPGGPLTVTGAVADPNVDASPVTVTYTVTPPGGSWDAGDFGSYTIAFNANEVFDTIGDPAAANPALTGFVVDPEKLLNESFETDGNSATNGAEPDRYTTSDEFFSTPSGLTDYFTRVKDTGGGPDPAIVLDSGADYSGFDRRFYFAAENVTDTATRPEFRVIDFEPINSGAFTGLSFSGLFGAGDNASGPTYDSDHFMAVLYSIDNGATYIPALVFRANANAGDATNHQLRQVNNIAPSGANGVNSLADLGAQLSAGNVVLDDTDANVFSYMAADDGTNAAVGTLLGTAFGSPFTFSIPDAPQVRLRVALQSNTTAAEMAFDNLMVSGTFTGVNQAPTALSAAAPDVGEPEIGNTTYSFDITYADDSAIDFTTIDVNDVTVTGPGGAIAIDSAVVNDASNGTPRVATYTFTPPGGSWDSADNGPYTIGIVANEVGDDDGTQLFVAANPSFASFNVNATNTDPVVSNFLAEDVIVSDFGETFYSFTVEYTDVGGVDVSSIDVNDVTVTGPGGPLTVFGLARSNVDGSPKTATYRVRPPGNSWDAGDAGTYTIGIVGSQVFDVLGDPVAADPSLTSFEVNPNKLLNETFETDGSGTRYFNESGGSLVEFHQADAGNDWYFTRVQDVQPSGPVGGTSPVIRLDSETEPGFYTGYDGDHYFAAEDVTGQTDSLPDFRVIDLAQINTSGFENLTFSGLFGAGDNGTGPAYDADHFLAVMYSTDGGTTYIPALLFRPDVTPTNATNQLLSQVTTIAPSGANGINTLADLGASLSAGVAALSDNQGDQFSIIGPDTSGNGADGAALAQALASFNFMIPGTPATVDLRIALHSDTTAVETAFDSLMLTGDVIDAVPPTLLAFARNTPANNPTNADTLVFDITFDEPVTNVTADDFIINGTTATGVIGGGGDAYTLTVSGGDLAGLNGVVGLDLAASQDIVDLANNALAAGEPATDETYLLDNTPPTLLSIERLNPATSPTNADSLTFRVKFDEPMSVFAAGDFVVTGTTATISNIWANSASSFDLTYSAGDLAGVNGVVGLDVTANPRSADVAGNLLLAGEPAIDETYVVDNTDPTLVAFGRNTPATSPTNADTLIFDIFFDEAVVNVTADDFVINGTTATGVIGGGGDAYTLTVSGGDLAGLDGTVGLDLAASQDIVDLANNALGAGEPATDETYVVENTAPTLLAFARNTPATSPTNADILIFDIFFDEAVVNVTADDFVINGTTATGVIGGGGSAYTLTVSGGDLAGLDNTVGLDLAPGQDIVDLADNALAAGEPAIDETYLVDNTVPMLLAFARNTPASSPTNADTLIFDITFDEAVVNVDETDFVINGTTATGVIGGGGSVYTLTISGGDLAGLNGTVSLDLAGGQDIEDLVGLAVPGGEPATDEDYLLDNIAPSLLSFERFNPPVTPTDADVLVFLASFDEDVANVDPSDFAANGTTATVTAVVPASASSYMVTVSGGDLAGLNGTVGIDLAGGQDITDLATNPLPPGEPAIDETYDVVNITAAPEFLVNDFTDGTQVTYAESRNVAGNAAGDLIITYSGKGPGDTQGVFARRFDATNTPLGPAFLVNVNTNSNQVYPSVAIGNGGESVVTWSGFGVGDNDGGVFIRLFDDTGVSLSGEIRVNQTVPSFQHRPVVAKSSNGDFIVVWSGKGNGAGEFGVGVYARRYAANGVPLTGEFLVNTTTGGNQQEPDVAFAADGSFVITWSGSGPGDASGVFFQRFNTAGSPVGPETRINTTISGQQKLPSVAMDAANNFTIVWAGRGNGDSSGIFLQRFNASGSAGGSEELVNTTTIHDQEDPSISVAPSGAAVVSWTSLYQDGSQRGVYAQEYSAAGAKVGGEIQLNDTTATDQKFSSVAVRGETAYTVVWSGRGTGDTTGVFAATRIRQPVPLAAASSPMSSGPVTTLVGVNIQPVVQEAKARWIDTGLSQSEVAVLNSLVVQVVDLDDGILGGNLGTSVYLDIDAAGLGWFVDATPADDSEFDTGGVAVSGDAAAGVDLLSVVMHEIGHALGHDHGAENDLMGESLPIATRRSPEVEESGFVVTTVQQAQIDLPTVAVLSSHPLALVDEFFADVPNVAIFGTPAIDDRGAGPVDIDDVDDEDDDLEESQPGDMLDDELLDAILAS